jgi:hypothetical protein
MTQLIQRIFDMLISINILKIAIKKTKVVLWVQTDNQCLMMAEVSEVAITKIKVWVVIKVTTIISEVVDLIQEDVEEVVITTIEEAEEATTIIMEDSKISFKVEIQEKITKQLNASSLNNQVNANLATSALLHMVMNSLDKLLQVNIWEDIMVAINNNSMMETKTWINNSSTTNTTST